MESKKTVYDLEADRRYLEVLARQFPTIADASTEIINLQAIMNLPKGTEHFLADIHGENEAFLHVLKTAKEKWRTVLQDESDALKRVVTLLLNARTLSRRNEFSLRHLCDLYAAIKFLDYDEEELKAILPRFSAIGFSRRAVAVLGRRLLLTEGFMPLRSAKRAKDL